MRRLTDHPSAAIIRWACRLSILIVLALPALQLLHLQLEHAHPAAHASGVASTMMADGEPLSAGDDCAACATLAQPVGGPALDLGAAILLDETPARFVAPAYLPPPVPAVTSACAAPRGPPATA